MKGESYNEALSNAYDILNDEIDISAWADFICGNIKKYGLKDNARICDIACGTGSMSVELEKRGYTLMSLDLSQDMLCIAENKARNNKCRNITFTCQDMRTFRDTAKNACVICLLDSLNCLMNIKDIKLCFESTNKALEMGGIFVFDVNSKYKFENVYGDNAYILENDGILCAWQNQYNEKSKVCDFYLSFFTENKDGTYQRSDEHRREKMYTLKSIEKALLEKGFEICGVSCDFDFNEADENKDERLYITAKKVRELEI